LLGDAFQVGDVAEAAREFKAHFSGSEVGNSPRHLLKLSCPLTVIAWGKHGSLFQSNSDKGGAPAFASRTRGLGLGAKDATLAATFT
jgi:hypothetical protein